MMAAATLLLLLLVAAALHVATVLGLVAAALSQTYSQLPMLRALGEISWTASADFILVAVPMFIMMGELLLRSGITESMYAALDRWVGHIPGGLMHTNIAACALFAATSGSSIATAATVGTIALPNMERYGYNRPLFLGTIAAGGTLGILIPPSINMIIYGSLSETPVPELYLAAMIPGVLMAALFMAMVLGLCMARAEWGGKRPDDARTGRWKALLHLLPPVGLFLLVVGSIYAGFATPTEAAALGVVASYGLAARRGRANWRVLLNAFEGTVRTTSMVMLIVIAAFFLNFVMSSIGLTDAVIAGVSALAWRPIYVLIAIIGLYLLLGCFVETLTLMVATTPIVVPVIKHLGYDAVWFGVIFVILIEAALITPPIGMNLFVVHSLRAGGRFGDLVRGSAPFLGVMLLVIALLIAWPGLALWLPAHMKPG